MHARYCTAVATQHVIPFTACLRRCRTIVMSLIKASNKPHHCACSFNTASNKSATVLPAFFGTSPANTHGGNPASLHTQHQQASATMEGEVYWSAGVHGLNACTVCLVVVAHHMPDQQLTQLTKHMTVSGTKWAQSRAQPQPQWPRVAASPACSPAYQQQGTRPHSITHSTTHCTC